MEHHHHHHGHSHSHSHCHGHSHELGVPVAWTCTYAAKAWDQQEGKLLIVLTSLLVLSSGYQTLCGFMNSDTHLVSEGFHSLFHALGAWGALVALSYSSQHTLPDSRCNFGYERPQLVIAFGNAVFAIFIGAFALIEALQQVFIHEHGAPTILIWFLVFKTVIEALIFERLRQYVKHTESNPPVFENLGVIALHCLGLLVNDSITVLAAFFDLHEAEFPWKVAPHLLVIVWVLVYLYLLVPYVSRNGRVLLLCSPEGKLKDTLVKKMREVSFLEGVSSIKDEKIWMLSSTTLAGHVTLRVHEDAQPKSIVQKTREILTPVVEFLTVEVCLDELK